MKFKIFFSLFSLFSFFFLSSFALANDANESDLQVKCQVDTFSLLNDGDVLQFGALKEALEEDACGHVPDALRDNGDPKRSGIGNVLLSCFAGILKGIFQSFWDSLKSFWDIFKVARKLAGIVGEKALRIVKAMWKGGVTAVTNEFISSTGSGFFAKIKQNFTKIFNGIKDYFVKKVKDVYQCYSPVAQGEVVCNAIAYLGTEFFSGFLFKAVGKIGKLASKAGDFLGLPGITQKLGKYATQTVGAHGKLKKFLQVTGPRALRKVFFKVDGLKKVVVKVNNATRKAKRRYNVLIETIEKGKYGGLGLISRNVSSISTKYGNVNKQLGQLNKSLTRLKARIEAKEKNAGAPGNLRQMREAAAKVALDVEKKINQGKILAQKLENTLVLANNAKQALGVGISLETFISGVSIDGGVLAGPFQR